MGSTKMQIQDKIAKKFGLTTEEVLELAELGLDTPTKIKTADPDDIPSPILAKLGRWFPGEE